LGKHGKYRALVGACLLTLAAPAGAAQCRLALLLAMDVSASVDAEEDMLQRGGMAAALLAPEVVEAMLADPGRPVVLGIYEWSGRFAQAVLLPWTRIETVGDLTRAAEVIGGSVRGRDDLPTALGDALGYGAGLFEKGPDCDARTLDVAGDGVTNDGFPPASAYRAFPFDGILVNGLAIQGGENDVAAYYREAMIRGAGAFVIEADGFGDYERAMREKLLRELSGPVIGMIAGQPPG
jgi:hypothetical protein